MRLDRPHLLRPLGALGALGDGVLHLRGPRRAPEAPTTQSVLMIIYNYRSIMNVVIILYPTLYNVINDDVIFNEMT